MMWLLIIMMVQENSHSTIARASFLGSETLHHGDAVLQSQACNSAKETSISGFHDDKIAWASLCHILKVFAHTVT